MKSSSHELMRKEIRVKQAIIDELNIKIEEQEQMISKLRDELMELQGFQEISERGEIKE